MFKGVSHILQSPERRLLLQGCVWTLDNESSSGALLSPCQQSLHGTEGRDLLLCWSWWFQVPAHLTPQGMVMALRLPELQRFLDNALRHGVGLLRSPGAGPGVGLMILMGPF